jgi:hypothetical protein
LLDPQRIEVCSRLRSLGLLKGEGVLFSCADRSSGLAAEEVEAGEEESDAEAAEQLDGMAIRGLDGGRRGARGVEALRAALGVRGVGCEERG